MKTVINMTTSSYDMERFKNREDFLGFIHGFDGVELMCFDGDNDCNHYVTSSEVVGLHMSSFPTWIDLWRGNYDALLKEFDNWDNVEQYYGSTTKDAIVKRFRRDLENVHKYKAEYCVFHISEATVEEGFTLNYRCSDEETIDAAAEIINEVFAEEDGNVALLMENLWQPGLSLTNPAMTKRLLDKVKYPNKGIMMDTGHLFHTNTAIKSQEEGINYIHMILDNHGELTRYFRGVHLNQSITGEFCEKQRKNPPPMADTFQERITQMFVNAFLVDKHQPFTGKGIKELLNRINPEFCNWEFITESREQHQSYLDAQCLALDYER